MIHEESTLHSLFEAPFHAALDEMPDALAIFTASDFPVATCIVYVNASFVRLTGYTRDELLGHSSLLLAGAKPNFQHVTEVRHAAKDAPLFASTRKFRPDGSAYDVDMWLSPLRDESGTVTHFLLRERSVANGDRDSSEVEARRQPAEALLRCAARA